MIYLNDKKQVSFGKIELFLQFLTVLSLLAFAIETLPDLDPNWIRFFNAFEIFTVAVFTLEYGIRVTLSGKRASYLFSFLGIVDLLAILPFYLTVGVDLRSLKAFRLIRVFRVFKLARYSAAMQRFHKAFLMT